MNKRTEFPRVRSGSLPAVVLVGLIALIAGLLSASTVVAAASPIESTTPAAPTGTVVVDPDWQPVGGVDGEITMMTVQSDGRIVIVGHFEAVGGAFRRGIARLNADGTLDASFDPGSGFGDVANAPHPGWWFFTTVNVAADGRIVVVGKFGSYNGVSRNGVVRILPTGAIDPTFNPGTGFDDSYFDAALVQPDGKIVVAGSFTTYNGTAMKGGGDNASVVVRLLASGALDKELPSVITLVQSLALAPDGKIVAGGVVGVPFSVIFGAVGRWRADGTRDASFVTGTGFASADPYADPFNQVSSVVVQADGKILLGGSFDTYNGVKVNGIIRLNVNGTLDAGFNVGAGPMLSGSGSASAIASPVRVAGNAAAPGERPQPRPTPTPSTTPRAAPVTISRAGAAPSSGSATPWPTSSYGEPRPGEVLEIILQPDGRALVVGEFDTFNAVARDGIVRLNTNGSVDAGFVVDPESLPFRGVFGSRYGMPPAQLTLQADGKILVGGQRSLFRLNPDGSVDSWNSAGVTTGTGTAGDVTSVAVQPDGKVLFAANSSSFNGVDVREVGRLNSDGTLDSGFGPVQLGGAIPDWEYFPEVRVVVPQAGGKVMIGGTFEAVGGVVRKSIARLNPDGSLDPSFNPGAGPASTSPDPGPAPMPGIYGIVVQPDGRYLVSGSFDSFDGVARRGLARLNADGSLDASFNPGSAWVSNNVDSVALQPDGKVLVGVDIQVGEQATVCAAAQHERHGRSKLQRRCWLQRGSDGFGFDR